MSKSAYRHGKAVNGNFRFYKQVPGPLIFLDGVFSSYVTNYKLLFDGVNSTLHIIFSQYYRRKE